MFVFQRILGVIAWVGVYRTIGALSMWLISLAWTDKSLFVSIRM